MRVREFSLSLFLWACGAIVFIAPRADAQYVPSSGIPQPQPLPGALGVQSVASPRNTAPAYAAPVYPGSAYATQPYSVQPNAAQQSIVQGGTVATPGMTSAGMSSKDFLKLMEEANGKKGIGVFGGDFPGAKKIPQASSSQPAFTQTMAPKQVRGETNPEGSSQTPSGDQPLFLPPPANAKSPSDIATNLAAPNLPPSNPVLNLAPPAATSVAVPTSIHPTVPSPQMRSDSNEPIWAPPPPGQSQPIGSGAVPLASAIPAPGPSQQPWIAPAPVQPNVSRQPLPVKKSSPQTPSSQIFGSYYSVWLERTGDNSTTFSQAGDLGGFGTEQAGSYTLGFMTDPMEMVEFNFMGTLNWDRHLQSTGPVNSLLQSSDPGWLTNFNQADNHEQFQTANLRTFALNKRLITDELGNSFYGLNIIDYSEGYRFESRAPGGTATMNFSAKNLLAGMHAGMELWRPFSQRFSLGGQGIGGLYGNFDKASWSANSGNGRSFNVSDQEWNLAFKLGVAARARYQFNSRCAAFGGYEWTYLGGLATVAHQPIGTLSNTPTLDMSTNSGFLLQGAQCGIEFQY